MLAARITLPHFSISAPMNLPKSAAEPPPWNCLATRPPRAALSTNCKVANLLMADGRDLAAAKVVFHEYLRDAKCGWRGSCSIGNLERRRDRPVDGRLAGAAALNRLLESRCARNLSQ